MAKGGYQQRRLEQKKQRAKMARKRARRRRLMLQGAATAAVFGLIIAILVVVLGGGDEGDLAGEGSASPTPSPSPTAATLPEGCTEATAVSSDKPTYESPPEMQIDPQKNYTATIETNCGMMTATLFAKDAPTTVNSFVFLAENDFFDGLLFHRVIDGFMIQGGDPQGTGSGGPGYQFEDENTEQQFDERGLLAMANSGPATNGSQFFITDEVITHLNAPGQCPGPQGCHSVFGKVTEGLEVLDRLSSVATTGTPQDRPLVDMVILDVTIQES